jgi:hypothetical protein
LQRAASITATKPAPLVTYSVCVDALRAAVCGAATGTRGTARGCLAATPGTVRAENEPPNSPPLPVHRPDSVNGDENLIAPWAGGDRLRTLSTTSATRTGSF